MISARTQVCAVIGDPVGHSLSPEIHKRRLSGPRHRFRLRCVPREARPRARGARGDAGFGIRGLSVTIPHKVDVLSHLDDVDVVARNIGCGQHDRQRRRRLSGFSTDGPGALASPRRGGRRSRGTPRGSSWVREERRELLHSPWRHSSLPRIFGYSESTAGSWTSSSPT